MKNRFYDALNEIKAEEQLNHSTMDFLQRHAYQKKKKATLRQFAVVFASLAFVFFTGLLSYQFYFTETSYLDIDVNPSIELALNRFDRVIGVYAYNADGQKVLDNVDIRHRSYEDALAILIDKMDKLGYVQDSASFTATLQVKDGEVAKEKLNTLKSCTNSTMQASGRSIKQEVFSVDAATKSYAHKQNLTPAKYLAILKLQEFDPSVTFNSCRNHSIAEIEQQIHDHTNAGNHGEENGNKSGNGGGKKKHSHN